MTDNTPMDEPQDPQEPVQPETQEEPTTEPLGDEVDDTEVETPPWAPEQDHVNYTEELKVREEPNADLSLTDCIKLIAESQQVIAQTLDRHTELFEGLDEWASEIKRTRRSDDADEAIVRQNPWFHAFSESFGLAGVSGVGDGALTREESQWRQVIDAEGMPLRPGMPKQKLTGTNNSIEERISYLQRRSGIGTTFDVPLYHSGVWLRLKSPSLSELTQLQQQMAEQKVTLGNQTKGMAFSNGSQSITSVAVDFALQFVVEANVHYSTPSDLKDHIMLLDLPVLLWGLAVTMWPKGYPYAHPCISDPEHCSHITKAQLNLNRLLWTDDVSISKHQRLTMGKKFTERLSFDDLKTYRESHVRGTERTVWFDDIGLTLKVPTLQEYEDEGRSWIDGIVEMTHGVFNEPPHGKNRDKYILRLGYATQARQYAHWVKSISERDPDDGSVSVIADDEIAINEILSHIFSTEKYTNDFFDAVVAFMDESTLSVIALPSFNCAACNTPQATKFKERFDHLIMMDVLTTFFTLVFRKLN